MKIIIAVVLLAIVGTIVLFFVSSGSAVSIDPASKIVGLSTPVNVRIANPHGVRRISAAIEQGGARFPLLEQTSPSHRVLFRRNQPAQTVTFEAGKNKAPNLKEGDARIVVETVADRTSVPENAVPVGLAVPGSKKLRPPSVVA